MPSPEELTLMADLVVGLKADLQMAASTGISATNTPELSDFLGTKIAEKGKDLAKRIGLKVSLPGKEGGKS
jgi:hypothetical protein